MYDAPYCSERCGENHNAGSTAEEMWEYYGNDLYYEPEHVAAVEGMLRDDALTRENARLRAENDALRDMLAADEEN